MERLRDVIKMIIFLVIYNVIVWLSLLAMLMSRSDTINFTMHRLKCGNIKSARQYLEMHQMCLFSKDIKKLDWFVTQEELKLEGNNNV